jgi:hypothetical protein
MPPNGSTPAQDDSLRDPPPVRRRRLRRLAALACGAVAVAGAIFGLSAASSGSNPARSGAFGADRGHVANRSPSAAHGRQVVGRHVTVGSRTHSAVGSRTRSIGGSATPSAGGSAKRGVGGASTGGAGVRNARTVPRPLQTSCRSVAHIGDSTSVDLISPSFIPNAAERLAARYAAVGVKYLRIDASGGRSIVEELPGQLNGYKVASAWRKNGYRGCWVFALGTNDAANIAAGSSIGMMARIDQMMAVAHGEPVMWVNTRTLLSGGPWANANERLWDKALVRALAKYPNMRIFNWSSVARPGWFLPDGIHYNAEGCIRRAKAIAGALARAFPLTAHSAGKIVR